MSIILITGAGGGLGMTVTDTFLKQGDRILALWRSEGQRERLSETFLPRYAETLTLAQCDVTREADIRECVKNAPGPISALVHLAGGIRAGTAIEETAPDTLEAMLNINVTSTFLLMRAVMPQLKSSGGAIVTIGARAVAHAEENKSAYAASKAAVVALTQTAAAEGRPYGVRANCILPSIMKTKANLEWGAPEDIEKWITTEEVAATIAHLCSSAGKGVSGAVIPMYGALPA